MKNSRIVSTLIAMIGTMVKLLVRVSRTDNLSQELTFPGSLLARFGRIFKFLQWPADFVKKQFFMIYLGSIDLFYILFK